MKLHTLMQEAMSRLLALIAAKWSGEITIRIALHRGGVRDARMFVADGDKWQVLDKA
jgi:hypothetical protein